MSQVLIFAIFVFSLFVLNTIIYYVFSNHLIKGINPGMKFLGINLLKDIIWIAVVLFFIDKTKVNFLILCLIFLLSSFLIYYFVVLKLNKS